MYTTYLYIYINIYNIINTYIYIYIYLYKYKTRPWNNIKEDLEKFQNVLSRSTNPIFSETVAFRPPSNWMSLFGDTQLELYLIEIEDELLKINEIGKK